MRLVVVGWWNECCESLRHTPDEIVMLLELLDTPFDVNPWGGKTSFYLVTELANCAEDRAFLPTIVFGAAAGARPFKTFTQFPFHSRPHAVAAATAAILMKRLTIFAMWIYLNEFRLIIYDNDMLILIACSLDTLMLLQFKLTIPAVVYPYKLWVNLAPSSNRYS